MELTVERCIETNFFKKHNRYMPAVLNLKQKKEEEEEIVEDLLSGEQQ